MAQENYKTKAMELNGPDFDWLHSPVDVRALYHCSCIGRHGKLAIFNRIVNDKVALAELKRSRASSMDAQRQRQEEENRMRKEARDSCMAKDFAQRMLEWDIIVHDHYDNMRRFMEVRVRHPSVFILVPIMQFSSYMHQISIYFRLLLCTVACQPHLFLHSCLPCFSLRHMVFHHLHVPLLKM